MSQLNTEKMFFGILNVYVIILLSVLFTFFCFPAYGADQKISELTALGAKPASDDELVIYDSSTGLTKKVDYTYLEDIKNVNLYGGLTAAVASIGATETTLLITDAQTVTANLSIPTTMQLFITRGGDVTVSAGKVLTINGTILAGAYQIFGSTGTITFSGSGVAYDNWWSSGGSTYTAGDTFYLDANKKFSTLAKGTVAQVLTMNSGATAPEWQADNIVKGWIQFNGTGTIAIQDSFNVVSITDNSVGNYTVTWDTDFANDDYAFVGLSSDYHTGAGSFITTAVNIYTYNSSHAAADSDIVCGIALGDQ